LLFGEDCLILEGLILTASVTKIEVRTGNCSSAALLTKLNYFSIVLHISSAEYSSHSTLLLQNSFLLQNWQVNALLVLR